MQKNNLSIYLRKENFEVYQELAKTMEIPLSSFIAQQLQEAQTMAMIKQLLVIAKQAKEVANGEQQGQPRRGF